MTTPHNPAPTTSTPPPDSRPMYCGPCGTYVPMVRSRSGEWLCGAGHNATAALDRETQLSADVGAAARLFLGMTQEEREKWAPLFLENLGPLAQTLGDAAGKVQR